MAERPPRALDGWTALWLGCAAIWSLGLVAAGFFVNTYSSNNGPGETLIQQNGDKVLIALLIPLLGVMIVGISLWHGRRVQKPGVGILVWVVFGLLAVNVVVGAFTIGPFVAPVAVFVVLAITHVKTQPPLIASATLESTKSPVTF
jgi:hypothetical protein